MNVHGVLAIYRFEMARAWRTIMQSIVSPVISTSLYFVVFGAAIGTRITEIEGVAYGAFIVPGLIMLSVVTQSTSNASFGIYFPKFIGTIYEILSAPVSFLEAVLGYVGAAATKSLIIGLIILVLAIVIADFWLFCLARARRAPPPFCDRMGHAARTRALSRFEPAAPCRVGRISARGRAAGNFGNIDRCASQFCAGNRRQVSRIGNAAARAR